MIDLYTKENCSFCVQAKNLLNRNNQVFREIPIGQAIMVEELKERFPDAKTAPVVVVNGEWIGGYEQLRALYEDSPQLING